MTMEAIQKVTELENKGRENKAEMENRIRQAIAESERQGAARLEETRREINEKYKNLLRQAEAHGAMVAGRIAQKAESDSDALRAEAKSRLDEAAEYIVGRVVKS